jgi:DNA-binding MarR family transcriptional regulator
MKAQPGTTLNQFSRQIVQLMPLMFREFAKREDNPLTRGKISFPQMVALDFVSRHPKVRMTDLSKVLSIQLSSTTVLVDRLIREKMLKRGRDESDRRLVWVYSTPKGRKIISQILEQKRQSIKQIFSVLTKNERNEYLRMISKVYRFLRRDYEEQS